MKKVSVISKIQDIKQKIVNGVLNKNEENNIGSVVKVSKVEKSFGEKKVLKDVSFECKSGESVIILGESGIGKSVLLRTISGFMEADSGSIKVDDTEMVNISSIKKEKVIKKMGFLFQYSGLFEHLSVWENIMFYELFIQHKNKEEMRNFALKLIEELYEHPTTGTGHPEPLKGFPANRWSRRINEKHRLVYRILKEEVIVLVLSSYGHNDDK